MKVILLAAGYATRLYPLTRTCPKALLPIAGRSLLDYVLDAISELQGVTGIALVTNGKFEAAFADYARSVAARGYPYPLRIYSDGTWTEETRLGALGDLAFVLDREGEAEDVAVMASDNLFTFSLAKAQQAFAACGGDLILGQHQPDRDLLRRFGVARLDADNRVLEMEEKSPDPISNWAVYATYFYRKETLPLLRTYLAEGGNPDAPGNFPSWLCRRTPVYFHAFEGCCIDIGTPESYAAVRDSWPPVDPV